MGNAETRTRVAAGDVAPSFVLPDSDGLPVRLDYGDAPATVVVFTSNGCPYALAWHDRIQQLGRDYAEQGVRLVQVVCNDETAQPLDSFEGMRTRVAEGLIVGDFLKDAGQEVVGSFGATATPEVYVVDQGGVVRYHGAPDATYAEELDAVWVRDALEAVLSGRAPERPDTPPAGCSVKWRVELLWWDGCPSRGEAQSMVEKVIAEMARTDVVITPVQIRSMADAERRSFPGSPTFQIGGEDLFPTEAPAALGCRVYQTRSGRYAPLPEVADLEARMRDALARPWELPGWVDFRENPRADA